MEKKQYLFNPADYGFNWTDDGWYEFNRKAAHSVALKERNKKAKELKAKGYSVVKFVLPEQMLTKGGIGSGYPEINVIVNVYGINVD